MPDPNAPADRSATGVVRRAALQHTANAERALAASQPTDIQVHRARKEIKRARAALRLLRAALPEPTYRREDAALRTVARTLNAARDARVLVRTLDALARRSLSLAKDPAVTGLARRLRRAQAKAQRQLGDRRLVLAGARAGLQQLQLRGRRWRVGRHGWSRLGPGLQRIYRAGRRARRGARRDPA